MSVTTQHPEYINHLPDWLMMDEAVQGESAVKANPANLPKPSGMAEAEKEDPGNRYLYANYTLRAQYPHWVKDALRSMIGLVSRLQPEIKLPPGIAGMEFDATADGFGLQRLFIRACREVLQYGRCALLVDIDDTGEPFVAIYPALSLQNWDISEQRGRQDLTLAVLKEQRRIDRADRYSHETEAVYRVLSIEEGAYVSSLLKDSEEVIEDGRRLTVGNRALSYIPLVVVGSTDNSVSMDEIPLLTMAKAALKSYQLSADLFTNAHATCHAQPVVVGLDDEKDLRVTGPSAAWCLPEGGNAFYLEPSGAGSAINERLMEQQRNAALEAGARVVDIGGVESGAARTARQNDQHSSLHTVVMTVADGIEQCLRYAGEIKQTSGDVRFVVKPDFSAVGIDPQVAAQLLQAALAGVVSHDTYWQYLSTGKVPGRDYQSEQALIENPNDAVTHG